MAAIGTSMAVDRPTAIAAGRLRSDAGCLACGFFMDIEFS